MEVKKELKTLARPSLAEILDEHSQEGELYQRLEDNKVLCYACGHRCLIRDGLRGICKVRYNKNGKLFVPKGYVAALQCDPTEKKPFFHVLPGSSTLTFGMLGCDYHCAYCQNWLTSQALRDSSAGIDPMAVTAGQMVRIAKRYGASMVGSSYNEPLITAEWAADVFRLAREQGFKTAFISNGNATPEVLKYLRPITDCYKVDLKSMQDKNYRKLGGLLGTVLETIPRLVEMGFWVEIVTLIVPGFNDSDEELKSAAKFLEDISPDIPWHVTAFHKDYKMTDPDNTSPETLIRAAEIGYEAGLKFVYAGNLPGYVRNYENTYCPNCHKLLVERYGYKILDYCITKDGKCPNCSYAIPGIWW
ncbi:MAG TPA: AmmeMemoRadiSam system radical SAM enzyme [Thermodesulfobacteriota bacterium]|nr:AmmeMemoRadiSam system radical SAM enzyme [Thermodesulfobacteriota bacterium]